MNNGLKGRYQDQLEAWNNARRFAAELVAAYNNSGQSIRDVISEWNISEVSLPSMSELKQMASDVLFLNGRNTVDQIARSAMKWSGWYEIEPPVNTSPNQERVKVAV